MDFESQIEKIAKDIRDREDREMAYELVKRLSPLLIANGVTVKATKYNLDEQVAVKEASSVDPFKKELVIHYGISIDGLDFTEHDKRFEDEIESLKKQIKKLESIRMRCHESARDSFDSGMYECLHIVTADELKTKDNIQKINLNETIKVKLTPYGAEIYYKQFDELNKECGREICKPQMPQIDKDGYTEFQLWHFIELYGEHIGMCKPNVIEPLDIVYCKHNRED